MEGSTDVGAKNRFFTLFTIIGADPFPLELAFHLKMVRKIQMSIRVSLILFLRMVHLISLHHAGIFECFFDTGVLRLGHFLAFHHVGCSKLILWRRTQTSDILRGHFHLLRGFFAL